MKFFNSNEDRSLTEDELLVCAQNLQDMPVGTDTVSEMYVCTNYLKSEGKLRIMVGRPNYS